MAGTDPFRPGEEHDDQDEQGGDADPCRQLAPRHRGDAAAPGGQRLEKTDEGDLAVQVGVPHRDRDLVRQQLRRLSTGLAQEPRRRRLHIERTQPALFVLQRDEPQRPDAGPLDIVGEGSTNRLCHFVVGRQVGDVDGFAALRQPQDQALQLARRVRTIDLVLSRYRLQLRPAALVQRDGRPVVRQRLARQVDHGTRQPIDVECRRHLAADTQERLQVVGPPFGVVKLGVSQGQTRGPRQPADQGQVPFPEQAGIGPLVQDLDDSQNRVLRLERRRHHRAGGEPRGFIHLVDEAWIVPGVSHQLGLAGVRDVAHDPRSQWQFQTLDLLAHRAAGDATDDMIALPQPDRARLRLQYVQCPVEHPGEQLVEVQGGVEFLAGLEKQIEMFARLDAELRHVSQTSKLCVLVSACSAVASGKGGTGWG